MVFEDGDELYDLNTRVVVAPGNKGLIALKKETREDQLEYFMAACLWQMTKALFSDKPG